MKLSETLLYDYTKKILGFAYEKTGNSCEAEDLAQEITEKGLARRIALWFLLQGPALGSCLDTP